MDVLRASGFCELVVGLGDDVSKSNVAKSLRHDNAKLVMKEL